MVSLFPLLGHSGILPLWPSNGNFIKPFAEKNLQSSSYDVSLSSEIQVLRDSSAPISINDQMAIDRIYERKDISEGYLIKPGEYILCKLKESITLPDDVMAMVVPRTRFTRLGLLLSTQYCNPSYSGTLSLGLRNASNSNISLVPGLAIGQLLFCKLGEKPTEKNLYRNKTNAAYHNEKEFRGSTFADEELSAEAKGILEEMLKHLDEV